MEFCHNVKPVKQPEPSVNPGGDCFACATLALINHLFPEVGFTLRDIHEYFTEETAGGSKFFVNYWFGYEKVFHKLEYEPIEGKPRLDIEFRRYLPTIMNDSFERHNPNWYMGPCDSDYFFIVDAFLRSGYILLTEIDSEGKGPLIASEKISKHKFTKNSIDHVVLIDGCRSYWPKKEPNSFGRGLAQELHVVDSNKKLKEKTYWLPVNDLIHYHGMAGFYLVRKSQIFDLEEQGD